MSKALLIPLNLILCSLFSAPAFSQVQRYERTAVRAHLLAMTTNSPAQRIETRGELAPDSQKQKFVQHYLTEIHPTLDLMLRLDERKSILYLLMDTGSENDAAEKAVWKAEYGELVDKLNKFRIDAEWTKKVKQWGELSEGLSGELADYARHYAKEWDLEQFPGSKKAILDQLELTLQNYKQEIIKTKAAAGIPRASREGVRIVRDFKSNKITFEEAQEQLNKLTSEVGTKFVGFEAVQATGDDLNRMAKQRTELAKAKGFKTWGEYQLENSGQGYSPAYRGAENQRQFLKSWITQLKPLVKTYYEMRLKEMGLEHLKDSVMRSHLGLLTPPDLSLMQPYFPADKITDIWEETMIESGFSKDILSQIVFDEKVRDGKNPTGAYMSGAIIPQEAVRTLDLQTLNFDQPQSFKPGLIYILQSYRGAGLSDVRTAFHEGMGHAFEYLVKGKDQQTSEGYGYVETPSTTSEYFTRDAEYLFHKAVSVDGKKPSIEQITEWVKNSKKGDALSLLARASSALYDLDLWDYDYNAPGAMTYLQRVEFVSKAVDELSGAYPILEIPGVPSYYHYVSSNHFISGQVRNIGYSYASLASHMMYEFITGEIEARTGHKSWYKQPALAEIFTDKFYKVGWKTQFPENIEKITGRRFDQETVLKSLTKTLTDDCCESQLK